MKKTLLSIASAFALTTSFAQTTFVHTECGTEFTLALKSDSTLWECGFNGNHQLGDSLLANSDTLIPVLPGQKWIYAAAGAIHTMAIAADSTLWGWGFNGTGALGMGIASTDGSPAQVNATQHWRYVSAGEAHTVAILDNGTLWATGYNYSGQLGTGDTTQRLSFVQIGTDNNWKTVAAGGIFTLGIKQDGTLWGWGYNGDGELGMGNTANDYLSPTQIGTDTNWTMVSGGFQFTLAMKSDGSVWSTGFNGNGQLGRTTSGTIDSDLVQIGTANRWKYIAAGASFGLAIAQNGTLWGWGFNEYGQLGLPVASASDTITQVGSDTNWHYISGARGLVSGSSVYGLHSAGLKTAATGLCTSGADYEGQLGNDMIISAPDAQFGFDCSVGDTTYTTGVTTIAVKTITVYPNPASVVINIDGIATTAGYCIYNMLGEIVLKGNLQSSANTVSINALAPGVYNVIIHAAEGEMQQVRIVKE